MCTVYTCRCRLFCTSRFMQKPGVYILADSGYFVQVDSCSCVVCIHEDSCYFVQVDSCSCLVCIHADAGYFVQVDSCSCLVCIHADSGYLAQVDSCSSLVCIHAGVGYFVQVDSCSCLVCIQLSGVYSTCKFRLFCTSGFKQLPGCSAVTKKHFSQHLCLQ